MAFLWKTDIVSAVHYAIACYVNNQLRCTSRGAASHSQAGEALLEVTSTPPAVVQSVAFFHFFRLISAPAVHYQGENGPDVNLAQLVTAYTRQFMKTNPEEALYYLALVKYCAALPPCHADQQGHGSGREVNLS